MTGPAHANNLGVNGLIGSVNVSYLLGTALRKDMEAPDFRKVIVDDVLIEGDFNVVSGMINRVNVTALNESVLRLNADETVESSLEFDKVITFRRKIICSKARFLRFY